MARTSKEELVTNASKWAIVADRELPTDVGYIMLFVPKTGGAGVVVSNLGKERVTAELRDVLRKDSRIVLPGN